MSPLQERANESVAYDCNKMLKEEKVLSVVIKRPCYAHARLFKARLCRNIELPK
jgi:hypothetical protein